MEASTATARVFRFGIFELDVQSGELRRHGLKVRLPDQSFQMLRLLLNRPGEVVTRDEARQRLWTADTFVDFDVGLNSAVRKLREALDDSAENPRFVETLPRRGYRFIASVTQATPDPISEPAAGGITPARRRVHLVWVAGGLVVAATIATLALISARGWWGRPGAAATAEPIQSLAVLPFENLTGDSAQDYFVDGMTDALTTDLAQVGGLHVISRTSAMQYKQGARKPVSAIGKELNVDAVVAGAIARSGQDVRITAQLIHAATDRHVWAQSYAGEVSDVLTLQQQMARAIAAAIQGRLAPARGGVERRQAVDPRAYDSYLKGVAAGGRQNYDGFRQAVAYFEDAVARQPDFAMAYAAMARAQLQFLFGGPLSPRETIPKAEAAARKALQLDDTLALGHRALGSILERFYWQWEDAEKEFARARALGDLSDDLQSMVPDVRNSGPEEGIASAERALRLDPLSFNAYLNVGAAYRVAGQYERAMAEIRRAFEITPGHNRAHFQLGVTLMFMGRLNDAIGELETAVKLSQGNLRFQAYLGYAYAGAGRPRDARRILTALESRAREQYVSSFGRALIHDGLGEREPALAAFERAYQDHAVEFAQMRQYPSFKAIASEPRYQAVMRTIGLPR